MFGGMRIKPTVLKGNLSELKIGHIVRLRDGTIGKVCRNEVNCNSRYIDQPVSEGIIWLGDYNDYLQASLWDSWDCVRRKVPKYDIVAIYEEQCIGNFLECIKQGEFPKNMDGFNIVWKRKQRKLNSTL